MSNQVYANGNEVSCKAAAGKSIAAFPDVCFTPPLTPATPPGVPIPYPNTGMASDTASGSKTVQISGDEVMLKDSSYFKQSSGDEAGNAPKKNVITSVIQGKCYYTAWSMDVKIEGENAVRHLDMMTHNHASLPGGTGPWPYQDAMSAKGQKNCEEDRKKEEEACSDCPDDDCCKSDKCQKARNCMLVPYGGSGSPNCCEGKTGHHLIEGHWTQGNAAFPANVSSPAGHNSAPTVCAVGGRSDSEHGMLHAIQGVHEDSYLPSGVNASKPWNYGAGKRAAVRAHQVTFMGSDCNPACIASQLDAFYGSDPNRPLQQSAGRQGVNQAQISREEAEVLVETYFGGM
jgi:hypothetical protein